MNDIVISNNSQINVWDSYDIKEIKQIYGKNLTDSEFKIFVEVGKYTGLNPFLREIWAVKYNDNPAQIFVGRDGYRKSAQKNPDYDYHHVDAIYSNDNFHFDLTKGEVLHTYNLKDRGKLVGAYCLVKKHSASKPIFVFLELNEYTTGKSLWAKMPSTMIKKCAEAQGLRMSFQELFAGTYSDAELLEKSQSTYQTIEAEVVEKPNLSDNESELVKDIFDSMILWLDQCKTLHELKTCVETFNTSEMKKYPEYRDKFIKKKDEIKLNLEQEKQFNALPS